MGAATSTAALRGRRPPGIQERPRRGRVSASANGERICRAPARRVERGAPADAGVTASAFADDAWPSSLWPASSCTCLCSMKTGHIAGLIATSPTHSGGSDRKYAEPRNVSAI